MDKAAVFIDGDSLFWAAKVLLPRKTKIDLMSLSEALCEIVKAERWRTYYYTSLLPSQKEMTGEERNGFAGQQRFLHALARNPRFEVRLGELRRRGSVLVETLTDVLLSIDLVKVSYNREIQKSILITGDRTFVAAIKTAKEAGVLTTVSFFRQLTSRELLLTCDQYVEISREFLESLQKEMSSKIATYPDAISPRGPSKMFPEILRFEKEIRGFIVKELQRTFSASSTATAVPNEIYRSWQVRKENDIRIGRQPEANMIDYADFSDYKEIILHNWKVFSNLRDKHKVRVYLDDLNNLCRKPTMHMRTITKDEIGMGKIIIRWFRSKMRGAEKGG